MYDRQSLRRRNLATQTPHISWTTAAAALLAAAFGLLALAPGALRAQEGQHEHGEEAGEHTHDDGHHGGLHFTHPLFAESVSPDRKVRLNYGYFDLTGQDEQEHSASVGFEYAFSRAFSVEAAVPYSFTDGAAGITSVSLKFANYALEEQGLLLGYGIGAGLPTSGDAGGEEGHDHDHDHGAGVPAGIPDPVLHGGGGAVHPTLGRDHWELSPFFNIGYMSGSWELVGFGTFGVPTGSVPDGDGGVSISYNASVLYHAGARLDLLAELHGSGGVQGHPVGEDVVQAAPGIRWQVLPESPLVLGAGASFPLTDVQEYDGRLLVSLFYHFGG